MASSVPPEKGEDVWYVMANKIQNGVLEAKRHVKSRCHGSLARRNLLSTIHQSLPILSPFPNRSNLIARQVIEVLAHDL